MLQVQSTLDFCLYVNAISIIVRNYSVHATC